MRVSCDSVAAKGAATRNGATLFAKNSDRPAGECQPLLSRPAKDHASGGALRCQYIEIPQVAHTHAFVGARPHWLWGLEHGVNEHGVAIGNHTIFTRDPVAETGLLGMDLVRLGLERAASARVAVDVITDLIERHGQGGSGYFDTVWPYHNSFLIADPESVFLLEASGRHWALREADAASASNHATIAADWSRISSHCASHARESGWWSGEGRFDFAAAYRDTSVVPPVISSGRYTATCTALARDAGRLDVAMLGRLMRDHGASGEVYAHDYTPDDERYYSVCMHADPVGTTTASMIAELANPLRGPVWVAFCNPCIGPYLPVFMEGELPADFERGGAERSSGGAWWSFKDLLARAEADWLRIGPVLRETWQPFEADLRARCAAHLEQLATAPPRERAAANTELMRDAWRQCSTRLGEVTARLLQP